MLPSPVPTDHGDTAAFEYTRRFTMPIWNAVLNLAFDYMGPIFLEPSFMKYYNNPQKIYEAKLPWTIWDAVTEVSNFGHNSELRRLPIPLAL